jgi:hypothetical protein
MGCNDNHHNEGKTMATAFNLDDALSRYFAAYGKTPTAEQLADFTGVSVSVVRSAINDSNFASDR